MPSGWAGVGRWACSAKHRPSPPTPRRTPRLSPATRPPPLPPAPGAAGAAAAAGKRSWLAPIAGIAAGLGLAALMSHLGMGEAMANILTMVLLAAVAFMVIRWLMRRFAGGAPRERAEGMQYAGAGAPGRDPFAPPSQVQPMQRTATTFDSAPAASNAAAGSGSTALAGFDSGEFERIAKMIFVRMQAAHDSGQTDDLRKFTTPEVFASLRVDLHDRGSVAQQTDVLQLDAKVLEAVQENDQWIVTVRFSGLIREESNAGADPFDELWHFVKPADGSREWAIAGIQQTA